MENEKRYVVTKTPFAWLYSDGLILCRHLRLSYPHVFHRYKGKGDKGEGKFCIVGLMPKIKVAPEYNSAKDLVRGQIERVMKEAKVNKLPAANKFLRDGDLAAKDEYDGLFTINASESRRPAVRDSLRDPKTKKPRILLPDNDEERIYAGGWGNILIRPWWQDNEFGKKVNAGLVMVQHVPIGAVREHYPKASDEVFGQQRLSDDEADDIADEFADDDSGYDDDPGDDDDI